VTAEGQLISSVHSLLVESRGQRIVIDTCLGNDKPRIVPQWNRRQGQFLAQISAAGFPREWVDFVVCTHLHPDHVGWNTMLVDGGWLPTFPSALHLQRPGLGLARPGTGQRAGRLRRRFGATGVRYGPGRIVSDGDVWRLEV